VLDARTGRAAVVSGNGVVTASNAAVRRPLPKDVRDAVSTVLRTAQAVPGAGKPANASAIDYANVNLRAILFVPSLKFRR